MDEIITKVASELPVVIVIVWFVLTWTARVAEVQKERDTAFREFLLGLETKEDERKEEDRAVLRDLIDSVSKLQQSIEAHDQKMDKAVAVMQARLGRKDE